MVRICMNLVLMGRICIRMLRSWFELFRICIRMFRISFEGLKFTFESLKLIWTVRICIWMLRVPFEFEFTFECFKSLSNGSNLHSNASNPLRKIRIYIRMFQIRFEWLELNLNPSNHFRIVWICIRMFRISFEGLKFAFECLKSGSNGHYLHSNASSPFRIFKFTFECF